MVPIILRLVSGCPFRKLLSDASFASNSFWASFLLFTELPQLTSVNSIRSSVTGLKLIFASIFCNNSNAGNLSCFIDIHGGYSIIFKIVGFRLFNKIVVYNNNGSCSVFFNLF